MIIAIWLNLSTSIQTLQGAQSTSAYTPEYELQSKTNILHEQYMKVHSPDPVTWGGEFNKTTSVWRWWQLGQHTVDVFACVPIRYTIKVSVTYLLTIPIYTGNILVHFIVLSRICLWQTLSLLLPKKEHYFRMSVSPKKKCTLPLWGKDDHFNIWLNYVVSLYHTVTYTSWANSD